ncbi:MAG: hypothetical protein M1347_00845 [Chloroflexi bacterium]|nr:hypothetical protein [Chloroflexota bacterium]
MKTLPPLFLAALIFLTTACAQDNPDLTDRQRIGAISFQNVPGFTVGDDGQGGV